MAAITFYRDEELPFLEAKECMANDLFYHKHFHEEYSIGMIDQGATNAWCDGRMFRAETGSVIGFPPLMLHACHPDQGAEWRYRMLFIKPEWYRELKPRERERMQIPCLWEGRESSAARLLINRTMNALKHKGDPLEIETALIGLIEFVAKREALGPRHEDHGHSDPTYVRLMRDYLHAHYRERITLRQLEEEAGISRFHLIRMFKKRYHMPPHAYQNLLRINRAKIELKEKQPIAAIAAGVGYYDQSHFSRFFTKIVGTTPGKYAETVT